MLRAHRPDQQRPDHRAAIARDDAGVDVGIGKSGGRMRKDDIAQQRKRRTKADSDAVDGGDDRHFDLEHVADKVASAAGRGRKRSLVERLLIAARAESAAGAGQHDRADDLVVIQIDEDLLQLLVHIPIDSIEDLRPVHRNDSDAAGALLDEKIFVARIATCDFLPS